MWVTQTHQIANRSFSNHLCSSRKIITRTSGGSQWQQTLFGRGWEQLICQNEAEWDVSPRKSIIKPAWNWTTRDWSAWTEKETFEKLISNRWNVILRFLVYNHDRTYYLHQGGKMTVGINLSVWSKSQYVKKWPACLRSASLLLIFNLTHWSDFTASFSLHIITLTEIVANAIKGVIRCYWRSISYIGLL